MIDDEKKYDDLIKTLKGLQQVKAPPNFEADLKRRLNAEKYAKEEKRTIKRFFAPSRLVPSFALASAAIVIFLMVSANSEEADNPFLMEPRVREDMILISDTDDLNIPIDNLSKKSEVIEEKVIADKKDKGMRRENFVDGGSSDESLIAGRNELAFTETTMIREMESVPTEDISAEEFTKPVATGLAIEKSGLNFRQVNPTQKEQEVILELKKKMRILKKNEKLE
ncbi:MAG: hypothetical protein IH852_13465 [Bacteroidetes bacterium]|nr:hypothetical protein [Bacteroidota bacterium]